MEPIRNQERDDPGVDIPLRGLERRDTLPLRVHPTHRVHLEIESKHAAEVTMHGYPPMTVFRQSEALKLDSNFVKMRLDGVLTSTDYKYACLGRSEAAWDPRCD